MDIYRLLKIGQKLAMNVIKSTYRDTLTAKWETTPLLGEFNEKTGQYEDAAGIPIAKNEHEMFIAAIFDESPNAIYKYAKYGINIQTDIMAVVPEDFILPDTTATYYRTGDPTEYRLKQIIKKGDIGTAPGGGLPETAYKVLHLRSGNLDS
jgi:hypothetical protein